MSCGIQKRKILNCYLNRTLGKKIFRQCIILKNASIDEWFIFDVALESLGGYFGNYEGFGESSVYKKFNRGFINLDEGEFFFYRRESGVQLCFGVYPWVNFPLLYIGTLFAISEKFWVVSSIFSNVNFGYARKIKRG